MKTFATLISNEQVKQIHNASLEILESIGLVVQNEKARALFAKHGCQINPETFKVKFPSKVVENLSAAFPSSFTFHGREPQYDRTIPEDGPVIITASSAANIIDPVTGQERRSTSEDIARIAHLINQLPGYDIFSISTLAEDAPAEQFTLSRLYPALKYCLKPIRSTTTNAKDAEKVLRLGELIAGSKAAYQARPFVTHHFCPTISPLTMDTDSTEMLIYFTERQLPVYPSAVPNAGLTAPMTMAGTIAQGNAEFLVAAVLMQMVREGTPLIYSALPTVADMRTGAYAPGGIECGMLHMACAQMARFYNVPYGGYIGLTNAKINDTQSGYETGMSTLGGVLAGVDMLNMGGLLDALKAFDFAKAVIDDEIAQMLKRVKAGFEVNEETLALDIIADVGSGGNFMNKKHTRKWMRSTALMPKIADREMRANWEKMGKMNTHERALQRARDILAQPAQISFSEAIDKKIRAEFKDLVPGNLSPL